MTGLEALLKGRLLVDRYRIEEVIGRGGMGAVYRALDERLGRRVAAKVITAMGAADADARARIRARFRHEAAAAARLPHHPNVVPVYDYGTDPTLDLDFIVMELLRGEDLSTELSTRGPPPLPTSLEILFQAARGLALGHRAGVIHRDVKPGNIFLVRNEGEEMQVRVLDFGIAKLMADEDTQTALTQDGRAPLSPAFASPEQLRGESRLTPASDVFSLGAVAFQLLTGDRPFSEADRNRMGIGLPVPVPSLRTRNPSLPAAIESVVQRALAHDPATRFPDAGAFAETLDRARRTGEGVAPPPIAYAAPGVIGGIAAASDDDVTRLAEEDHTLLAPEPRSTYAAAPPGRGRGITPPSGLPSPAEPARTGNRPFLWTLVLLVVTAGALFAWMSTRDSASFVERPLSDLSDSLSVDTLAEVVSADPLDAAVQNLEGERLLSEQRYAQALDHFQRALQVDPDNPKYLFNEGYTLLQLGRPAEAAEALRRAVAREPDNPSYVAAYNHLAEAALAVGDTAGAVAALESYIVRSRFEPGRQRALELLQRIRSSSLSVDTLTLDTTTAVVPSVTDPRTPARRPAPVDTIRLGRPAPGDTIRLGPPAPEESVLEPAD